MNCRLDRMKDSGIEWIGEIPEDWEISKIKFVELRVQLRADGLFGAV